MAMGPLISWALFISVVGAIWFVSQRQKTPPKPLKKLVEAIPEKVKAAPEKVKAAVIKSSGGGAESSAGEAKKKAKKKAKKATPAASLSNSVVKEKKPEIKSDDDDDDVAEEVDLKDVARRLRAGGAGRYAGSQTSSTGADGDIDEEEYSKSNDPTDMLEPSTSGPGVLRIGAPVQPPRTQKKKSAPAPDVGLHASKNAKKKEKEKAARAQERAEQHARLEQHRKAQRAAAASAPSPIPTPTPAASTWTQVSSKKAPRATTPVPAAPSTDSSSSALLDTFTPGDSDSEPAIQRSTTLGDSWESIPPNALVPEPQWNEVKSKKSSRSMKKSGDDSADETITLPPKAKTPTPAPEPVRQTLAPPVATKQVKPPKKQTQTKGSTTSGSDWAEVDNLDNWEVHPESSDY